jgi:hypothetical protein
MINQDAIEAMAGDMVSISQDQRERNVLLLGNLKRDVVQQDIAGKDATASPGSIWIEHDDTPTM